MAKRARSKDTQKMLKKGRGNGIGKEYIPWIRIQEVASQGRVTRVKGIKTGRQHELSLIWKEIISIYLNFLIR